MNVFLVNEWKVIDFEIFVISREKIILLGLFHFLAISAVLLCASGLVSYDFPDPIEHYRECGLAKAGRFCDPKSLLTANERNQANEALIKLPVNGKWSQGLF